MAAPAFISASGAFSAETFRPVRSSLCNCKCWPVRSSLFKCSVNRENPMSIRVAGRSTLAGVVVVLALSLLSSHALARQTRTQRGYLGTVTSPRVSTDDNGHIVVSLEATGELRGVITIELDPDG